MKGLAFVSAALLLVAACPDRNTEPLPATGTPTSAPDSSTPGPVPGLFLVAPDGAGTSAVPGTRCWVNGCVDYVGPVTNPEPVVFPAGETLQWQAEGGTVTEFQHAWLPVEGVASTITSDGLRLWSTGLGEMVGEPVRTPSEPGEYVLMVFTRYSNGGDVLFAAYIAVE